MPSARAGTATAASTLVNSEPGPTTTWSARASAARATGEAGGSVGTRETRWMCEVRMTSVCPSISPAAASALRTTGSVAAGTTRPTAPRSRAASSSPFWGSPQAAMSPAMTRLPRAWPTSSSASKRCSKAAASAEPSSARATRHLRRSPGGMMSSWRRSRPDDPPSSATDTTAVSSPA